MKKSLFILFMLTAYALSMTAATKVSESEYTGIYTGTLDGLRMNGKDKNPVYNQQFKLENGVLSGVVSQIGTMPGTIYISIKVSVDDAGNIKANNDDAGKLVIGGKKIVSFNLTSFSATVANGVLDVNCAVSARYSGLFPASFHFYGYK